MHSYLLIICRRDATRAHDILLTNILLLYTRMSTHKTDRQLLILEIAQKDAPSLDKYARSAHS